MHGAVGTKDYNLFNAFFLFAPALSFAVLFTAFVVVFVVGCPAILASAVPKGDGWRSFCFSPSTVVRELLLVVVGRVLDGDALRGCTGCGVDVVPFGVVVVVVGGMLRVGVAMDSIDGWGRGVALTDFEVEGVESDFDGISNSGGRTCEMK